MSKSVIKSIEESINDGLLRLGKDILPFHIATDLNGLIAEALVYYNNELDLTVMGLLQNITEHEQQIKSLKDQIQVFADADVAKKRELLVQELEANRKIMEKLVKERSDYVDKLNNFKDEAKDRKKTSNYYIDVAAKTISETVIKLLHIHNQSLKLMSNQYNSALIPSQLLAMPEDKLKDIVEDKLKLLRQQLQRVQAETDKCEDQVRKIQAIKEDIAKSTKILK